ncbi:hypothetical protein M378DRAFT_159261 [Amanita muscaria Koide BX008]|uniref:Uncharacterized protein n=1 Tax=Amanita muscaria (strain Koide BX008) TaxID=946122 RepID=A0A0C2XGI6_AMAMK|nr:hypothetical protein M378DRAFT_159261 [Amanita muscaria Koide BX008]
MSKTSRPSGASGAELGSKKSQSNLRYYCTLREKRERMLPAFLAQEKSVRRTCDLPTTCIPFNMRNAPAHRLNATNRTKLALFGANAGWSEVAKTSNWHSTSDILTL